MSLPLIAIDNAAGPSRQSNKEDIEALCATIRQGLATRSLPRTRDYRLEALDLAATKSIVSGLPIVGLQAVNLADVILLATPSYSASHRACTQLNAEIQHIRGLCHHLENYLNTRIVQAEHIADICQEHNEAREACNRKRREQRHQRGHSAHSADRSDSLQQRTLLDMGIVARGGPPMTKASSKPSKLLVAPSAPKAKTSSSSSSSSGSLASTTSTPTVLGGLWDEEGGHAHAGLLPCMPRPIDSNPLTVQRPTKICWGVGGIG